MLTWRDRWHLKRERKALVHARKTYRHFDAYRGIAHLAPDPKRANRAAERLAYIDARIPQIDRLLAR